MDIIILTVCAVLSGAEGWEVIAGFGHEKQDWLRQFVPLKNGILSFDCLAYVISRLSPKEFQRCFVDWVEGKSCRMKLLRSMAKRYAGRMTANAAKFTITFIEVGGFS